MGDGKAWDGRYRIGKGTSAAHGKVLDAIPESLIRAALAAQPGGPALPLVAPWAQFLPDFDLAPARAAAALVGAPMPPDAPLHGPKWRKA